MDDGSTYCAVLYCARDDTNGMIFDPCQDITSLAARIISYHILIMKKRSEKKHTEYSEESRQGNDNYCGPNFAYFSQIIYHQTPT